MGGNACLDDNRFWLLGVFYRKFDILASLRGLDCAYEEEASRVDRAVVILKDWPANPSKGMSTLNNFKCDKETGNLNAFGGCVMCV